MPPLDLLGQSLPKEKSHSTGRESGRYFAHLCSICMWGVTCRYWWGSSMQFLMMWVFEHLKLKRTMYRNGYEESWRAFRMQFKFRFLLKWIWIWVIKENQKPWSSFQIAFFNVSQSYFVKTRWIDKIFLYWHLCTVQFTSVKNQNTHGNIQESGAFLRGLKRDQLGKICAFLAFSAVTILYHVLSGRATASMLNQ